MVGLSIKPVISATQTLAWPTWRAQNAYISQPTDLWFLQNLRQMRSSTQCEILSPPSFLLYKTKCIEDSWTCSCMLNASSNEILHVAVPFAIIFPLFMEPVVVQQQSFHLIHRYIRCSCQHKHRLCVQQRNKKRSRLSMLLFCVRTQLCHCATPVQLWAILESNVASWQPWLSM